MYDPISKKHITIADIGLGKLNNKKELTLRFKLISKK